MLRFLSLALLALLAPVHAQSAQPWTLQTAAFSDAARADVAVRGLRQAGFDAYSERAQEVTRVRVGCFLDRESAEVVAVHLARRTEGRAQIVALNRAAVSVGPTFCVRREAGFTLPARWGVAETTPDTITFWVNAAGPRALRFDGRAWRIRQSAPLRGASERAEVQTAQAAPVRAGSLFVGFGRTLWRSPARSSPQTFVVQDAEAISTLTLIPFDEVD